MKVWEYSIWRLVTSWKFSQFKVCFFNYLMYWKNIWCCSFSSLLSLLGLKHLSLVTFYKQKNLLKSVDSLLFSRGKHNPERIYYFLRSQIPHYVRHFIYSIKVFNFWSKKQWKRNNITLKVNFITKLYLYFITKII